ncbi:unnamed protein product [Strongylus vulgaris]|uniref:F-box associated domain-containing protein n=1 Tax=Strongylus vulgaris TaxID=40348 RepID=A0A3P7JTX1_STRVU|nr:unnamed protein product [Strongylus vulgaris]
MREQLSTSILQAKRFEIFTYDRSIIPVLVPFLPFRSEIIISSFELDEISLDTDFFDLEVIRTARELLIIHEVKIIDEQLGRLQAYSLQIRSPLLTSQSINGLILQWLNGRRKIALIKIQTDKVLQWNELLNGIDPAQIRDLDDSHRHFSKRVPIASRKLIQSKYGSILIGKDNDTCALEFSVKNVA